VAQPAKSAKEFQLGRIPGDAQVFSLTESHDSERLFLDLCHRYVSLSEEPDARNPHVRFCEGLGPTDVWLKWCGTAGKPGGKRRKKTSTCSIARNRSTRLNCRLRQGTRINMGIRSSGCESPGIPGYVDYRRRRFPFQQNQH
jgi:hypothetical protein